jgi:hypothetical protein
MDNPADQAGCAKNAHGCQNHGRRQPTANPRHGCVKPPIKQDQDQGCDTQVEAKSIVAEADSTESILACEHPESDEGQQCRHAEASRRPAQENRSDEQGSDYREVFSNLRRHFCQKGRGLCRLWLTRETSLHPSPVS